jgi:hypothetical protein
MDVLMILMPSVSKMALKTDENLLSQSRINNRAGYAVSASYQRKLRACWLTQAEVGER